LRTFEISSKQNRNGKRNFKVVLCKIHPDSCVDEVEHVGTEYNINGITWLREYCEKALPSINGMSLRCEFIDDARTEIYGHGDTDIIDGEPIFEDATMIGTFTKGYIGEIETENETITAVIGEGEIDSSCYHNFCEKLDKELADGINPSGSVEIMRTAENDGIVYKYGYVDKGRIPMEFNFSGYALLGIPAADKDAKLLELNEKLKEDSISMTENEIQNIVAKAAECFSNHLSEINQCKADCEAQVAEANEAKEAAVSELNELQASAAEIQKALDEARDELSKKYEEIEGLYTELEALRKELGEAKARERVGELSSAIEGFSDEEKAYAQEEIDAFKANPVEGEINAVVSKIYEGIGKNAKAEAEAEADKVISEQNAAKDEVIDIFGEVLVDEGNDDISIF